MNQFSKALLAVFLFVVPSQIGADEQRAVYETEIEASPAKVWQAFTTQAGLQSWMAPHVEIDFRVGGLIRSTYDPQGKIGDSSTIENTILCFDPHRMLALKASKFPAGFPFEAAAKETWSVFYFSELGPDRTKITVVGLGYTDNEDSKRMRAFFATANKAAIEKLRQALKAD